MRHLTVDRDDAAPGGATKPRRSAMTAEEVGAFLQLSASTVRRLAARGELPGRRIAGTWRFDRDTIENLIPQR
jgi:excisionase family DNA binding protein